MFSRKKDDGRDAKGKAKQLGLLDVPDPDAFMNMNMYGDDDDDDDLEAELAALQSGETIPEAKPTKKPLPMAEIERMAAESMKDTDEYVDDEDLEEDAELLAELQELAGDEEEEEEMVKPVPSPKPQPGSNSEMISLLKDRQEMYMTAINTAKAANDSSKVRRYERGLKTLKDLERSAKSGKTINEDDIPPSVATGSQKPTATPPVAMEVDEPPKVAVTQQEPVEIEPVKPVVPVKPVEPVVVKDEEYYARFKLLSERKDQYKMAALVAKKQNDIQTASAHYKIAKQFELVIEAMEQGKPIDLSNIPPPPPSQKGTQPEIPPPSQQMESYEMDDSPPQSLGVPSPPKTPLEALQQRLDKYKAGVESAKKEDNSSKARRMGRIVKQFEDAIKKEKLGKPVNYEELPCPPGFPPIPGTSEANQAAASLPVAGPSATPSASAAVPAVATSPPMDNIIMKAAPTRQASPPKKVSNLNKQQLDLLQSRQRQFKTAALQAKNRGDIDEAKRLLKQSKGFDQMIMASQSGLPVNLKSIPAPPGADTDFMYSEASGHQPTGDRDVMYKKLEDTLKKQIETCNSNSQYFTRLGDIPSAKQFDKMADNCRLDLDTVKNAYAHGDPVPRFHYEQKVFSMVKCNTDINDNEIELVIVRGINYSIPSGMSAKDLDTFVKYDLQYPKDDDSQSGKTDTVKHTNNPEYNASYKFPVLDRKSRSIGRHFKRVLLKLDVLYERGFFKGNKSLGQASLKLADLETKCEIHDGLKLMDGRKAAGGTIEIKVRIRQPLGSPEVEDIKEKWLVIDDVHKPSVQISRSPRASPSKGATSPPSAAKSVNSIEVMKLDMTLNEKKVNNYKARGQAPPKELIENQQILLKKLQQLQSALKNGGQRAAKVYVSQLMSAVPHYQSEAQQWVKQGNKEMATVSLTKKKLIENEIRTWQQRC